MGLNWVEDVVSHLYKLRGYMVIEDEPLQLPKTENIKIRGHSDIDVLAIKDDEIVHIECQSWWGPSLAEEKKHFERLTRRFDHAPDYIFKKYSFLDKNKFKIKNILVTSGKPKKGTGNGPWDRLEYFCNKNCIELLEIDHIIKELISELKLKYPKRDLVGKEEGIARFLLYMIHNGFLEEK